MLNSLLTRIFGSRNDRLLRQFHKNVAKINSLEAELEPVAPLAGLAVLPVEPEAARAGKLAARRAVLVAAVLAELVAWEEQEPEIKMDFSTMATFQLAVLVAV